MKTQKWLLEAQAVRFETKEIDFLLRLRDQAFNEGFPTEWIVRRIKKIMKDAYHTIPVYAQ